MEGICWNMACCEQLSIEYGMASSDNAENESNLSCIEMQ